MSAAALAFAVVMLLASSTVHVFAATVNMNMNDWNTFQQLLKDAYGSFPSQTVKNRFGVTDTTMPYKCETTNKDAVCSNTGTLTSLKFTSGVSRNVQSWSIPNLLRLTNLNTLELSGSSISGALWVSRPFPSALTSLRAVNTNLNGQVPSWVWELPKVQLSGNSDLARELPATVSRGPTQGCSIDTNDFWACPIPMWAELICNVNITSCLPVTSAPTPMPTPPTSAPTPAPTPAPGDCLASLIPCPDAENSTVFASECAMAGFSCQWTCCLRDCTEAYSSDKIDVDFDTDYSCAKLVGAPNCGETTNDCGESWAPPTADANGTIDIGFNQQVFGEAIIVVMNNKPGMVSGVEVFDYQTMTWVGQRFTPDGEIAIPANRTLARFAIPGHIRSDRIRVNTTTVGDTQEIDGILLIGRDAPAPTLMPTPMPPPCLPPVELVSTSPQIDDTIADRLCVNSACQWACSVNNCTDDIADCERVVGDSLNTWWSTRSGTDEVIEVSFGLVANATALVVVEAQLGSAVVSIDAFLPSNSSYVNVFTGTINATTNGAEVYLLRPAGEPVKRLRVKLNGFRSHQLAAIRLVGAVPPRPTPMPTRAPQLPTPRLPGQFKKIMMRLANNRARFGVLAQNTPAPVLDDVFYVPPGENFTSNFFTQAVQEFDRCNSTSLVCSRYSGMFSTIPAPLYSRTAGAAMRVGGERVVVVVGSRLQTQRKTLGDIYWRTDSAPEWQRLQPVVPRHETCVVAVPATGEFFMGGGREVDDFFSNLLLTEASIERISFAGNSVESIRTNKLAFSLSQARAEPGCNVIGRNQTLVMFAGGRFNGEKQQEPSDVVDILDVITQTLKTSRLSHKAVAVTIASVGSLVMVTGGSPTCGPPQCGIDAFRYTSYENLGVDRYDVESDQWQYVPFVLTEGVMGGTESGRLPVTLANRFIAVVGGLVELPGNKSESPIDLYDTYTSLWHRNVLQHHASYGFMVAGVANRLVIAGGVTATSQVSDLVTVFEWEPYKYELIDCSKSLTCGDCLTADVARHYEPCRWCQPSAGVGQCILDSRVCPPFSTTILQTANGTCPTPMPTPVPLVRYFRLHRFVLARDFATWNFTAFAADLSAHLGCATSALSEFAPAQNGSVIAYVKHEEGATDKGAQYDAAYGTLTTGGAPALNVTSLTLLPQDFTLPPTSAPPTPPPTPTTASPPTSLMSLATPAPTPEDLTTLYIVVGVIAGLLLLLLVACLIVWVVQRNRRAVEAARRDGELASATQYELANRTYDRSTESGRAALTVTGTGQIAQKYLLAALDIEKGNKLGEGAFGVVYKGRWRNIEVAIKEVKYEAMTDPAQIASLEQEAVKMANMRSHQNVVQLYGLVQHPLSIVVEFCAKGALDDWLRSDDGLAASTTQLLKIVNGIAKGVAHLHAENIIHRDLAARNILLSEGLLPKVADFGMSRDNQGEDKNQTKSHVGPLKWMAPEQLLKQQYSRASDVFAFGVVIYETLSGREPWEGLPNTAACFAARDHQLLTSAGFLYLEQLLERVEWRSAPGGAVHVADWRGLRAATLDAKRGALVYETPRRLVVNRRAPQAVVTFRDAAAGVDIVATTNHEMYVSRGKRFVKQSAAELANVRGGEPVQFLCADNAERLETIAMRVDAKSARVSTIDDATWCFDMNDGFVVVRRAPRVDGAVVSRATVQGNCHKVLNGERLPVPARAPGPLGDLMRLCFETEPDLRPTMDDACRRLERIVAEAEDADGESKREKRKSTKRKSKTLGQSATNTDYDEPDVSDKLSTYNALPNARDDDIASRRLAVSDAYSLAPDPRADHPEPVGAYEAAPPAANNGGDARAAVLASAPGNDTLTDDGAYSTPDLSTTTTAAAHTTAVTTELQRSAVAPAVAKLSDKDQARLWRLSKKYEPKSEPPAMTNADPQALTTTDSGRVTTLQPTGLSDQFGPLPDGWRCAVSPKSGRVYYYRKGEKTTSWVRPTE